MQPETPNYKTDFLRLPRQIQSDYQSGQLRFEELWLLIWLWLSTNPYNGKVKVSYDPEDIVSEKSPDYILIAYYALREGIKKDVDLAKKLSSLGFLVRPLDSDLRKSIDAFNPRFTE